MSNVLSNMQFGKIKPGMIRLGMNGQLAVNINGDYKYYNEKKNTFVNTNNFVFDIGEDFFFVMPTNSVKRGDIILINNKPVFVLEGVAKKGSTFKVLSYEDGQVKELLPERHTFLGKNYMYSKIVSMFGNKAFDKGTIMKYMMFNTMMGGKGLSGMFGGTGSGMNPMMLMMMMGGKNPMTDMFNFDDDAEGLFGGFDMFGADEAEDDVEAEDLDDDKEE